jgi:hypothetical protein
MDRRVHSTGTHTHPNKAQEKRQARTQTFEAWEAMTGNPMLDRLAA